MRRLVVAVAIITAMTRGDEARLFVALDLPAEVCARLVAWARAAAASVRAEALPASGAPSTGTAPGGPPSRRREARPLSLRQLRLLRADALHVTLCFLGDRRVEEIEVLGDALAMVCAEAAPIAELALGAPLWLPSRHPRALAVELHDTPDGKLEALRDALAAACGLPPERRRFHPHATVARMRPSEAPRERGLPATPALSFRPRSVTLHRSWLTSTEAVYEGLATCSLAGGPE